MKKNDAVLRMALVLSILGLAACQSREPQANEISRRVETPSTTQSTVAPTAATATPAEATSAPVSTAAPTVEPTAMPEHPHATASSKEPLAISFASLPATILDPNQFPDPEVRDTYAKAKQVPERLAKMYCYCHCHEHMKHVSLLTCFQTDHAAECGICLREGQQAWLDAQKNVAVEQTQKTADLMFNGGNPPPPNPATN